MGYYDIRVKIEDYLRRTVAKILKQSNPVFNLIDCCRWFADFELLDIFSPLEKLDKPIICPVILVGIEEFRGRNIHRGLMGKCEIIYDLDGGMMLAKSEPAGYGCVWTKAKELKTGSDSATKSGRAMAGK